MTTATKSHDSLTCKLGPDGQPCTMCWWANESGYVSRDEHHIHECQTVAGQPASQCACGEVYDYETDMQPVRHKRIYRERWCKLCGVMHKYAIGWSTERSQYDQLPNLPTEQHSVSETLPEVDTGFDVDPETQGNTKTASKAKAKLDQERTGVAMEVVADNLASPPNFESAWATAPPEYSRYVEQVHALYWYLRGMQDEQQITRLARRSLAREYVAEMGRLAQVRRERE